MHSQSITTFLSDITIILNNLKNKNVVLLGDMNIDILPPINENVSLDYLYLMSSFGFESLVNSVTRPSSGTYRPCFFTIIAMSEFQCHSQ